MRPKLFREEKKVSVVFASSLNPRGLPKSDGENRRVLVSRFGGDNRRWVHYIWLGPRKEQFAKDLLSALVESLAEVDLSGHPRKALRLALSGLQQRNREILFIATGERPRQLLSSYSFKSIPTRDLKLPAREEKLLATVIKAQRDGLPLEFSYKSPRQGAITHMGLVKAIDESGFQLEKFAGSRRYLFSRLSDASLYPKRWTTPPQELIIRVSLRVLNGKRVLELVIGHYNGEGHVSWPANAWYSLAGPEGDELYR